MDETPLSGLGMNMVVDLQTNAIIRDVLAEDSIESSESNTSVEVGSVSVDLPCPTTPQLRIKFPELNLTSSDSDEDPPTLGTSSTAEPTRAASPPPNCAICLGRCKNKCFTDSCLHQFCFKCLCEWSKVKPECPLCKQIFKSIIHNVKPEGQFEEYHVPTPIPPVSRRIHRPIQVTAYEQLPYIVDGVVVRAGRHLIYPYPVARSARTTGELNDAQSQSEQHNELIDLLRQDSPNTVVSISSLSQVWRRYVYERNLYAVPVADVTGVFRECSAAFYRENPAQIHRLMPWINRDVVCLVRHTDHDVTTILSEIQNLLPLSNILSPTFRRRLRQYFGDRTAHFIHELHNFARSPYDMLGYDRIVQYSRAHSDGEVIEFSSSNDEADNIPGTSEGGTASSRTATTTTTRTAPEPPTEEDLSMHQYRVQTRNASNTSSVSPRVNLLSFTISTTSEGTESPGVTVAVSSNRGTTISRGGPLSWPTATAINLTTHNRSGEIIIDLDDTDVDGMATIGGTNRTRSAQEAPPAEIRNVPIPMLAPIPAPTYPVATVTDNIELSSASSDECEFVLERKPPHLRTPELVSLNSESDSDVVFVDESKPLHETRFSSSENENETPNERAKNINGNPQTIARTRSKRTIKHEHETQKNGGASTSTELRKALRKRRAYEEATSRAAVQQQTQQQQQQSASSDSDEDYMPMKKSGSSVISRTSRTSGNSRISRQSSRTSHNSRNREKSAKKTKSRKRRLSNDKSGGIKKKSKKSKYYITKTDVDTSSDDDEGVNLMLLKQRIKIDKLHQKEHNIRSSKANSVSVKATNLKPNDDAPSTSAAAASKNFNKVLPIKLVWGSKSKVEIVNERGQSSSPSTNVSQSSHFFESETDQSSDVLTKLRLTSNSISDTASVSNSVSSSSSATAESNHNSTEINNESHTDVSSSSHFEMSAETREAFMRRVEASVECAPFTPEKTDSSDSASGEDY